MGIVEQMAFGWNQALFELIGEVTHSAFERCHDGNMSILSFIGNIVFLVTPPLIFLPLFSLDSFLSAELLFLHLSLSFSVWIYRSH